MARAAADQSKSIADSGRLDYLERRVCEIAADRLGFARSEISPHSRLIEDLGCDSLDLADLMVAIEEEFNVDLEWRSEEFRLKTVFTRRPFYLSDLAELAYLNWGTGRQKRRHYDAGFPRSASAVAFTQLGGKLPSYVKDRPLYEGWGPASLRQFRRRLDGMRCVSIPAATVEIGTDDSSADHDARPKHVVVLDSFLIDLETVSTTAYCRFLDSIGDVDPLVLRDWFVLDPADDRQRHELIERKDGHWSPKTGVERKPMMLVSWYGANAYSLWANLADWRDYRAADSGGECFLPSEAQWEYAARGASSRSYPWGEEPVTSDRMICGRHAFGTDYTVNRIPIADVNAELGMSPFGLHHVAGNVWQWCRDWYSPDFYRTAAASEPGVVNLTPTGVRSERGGSFVGPAKHCRSSYRRGRNPEARGRCLGFRCVSPAFVAK